MGHSNRNKRVNEEMNPISVHSESEKRVKADPPATVDTLSSKNFNEEDLLTITTSAENKRRGENILREKHEIE
jgi:hypothetical protein